MIISEITLYDLLKTKIGEEQAKAVVQYVEAKVEREFEQKKDVLATKEDIHTLELKIENTRSDIIKWMFIFWVSQFASMIALLKFLK